MRYARRARRKWPPLRRERAMSVPFSADLALASAAARGDTAAVDVLGQRMRCIGRFVAGIALRQHLVDEFIERH